MLLSKSIYHHLSQHIGTHTCFMFVNYSHLARYIYINKHIHVYLFIYLFFFLYLCHQQAEGFNQHKYQEMNLNGGWGTKRNADGTNQCQVNIPTVRTELNMVPTVGRKMVQHSTGYPCTGPSAPPNLWGFMDFAFVPKGGSK